jgi:hypothetical protein
MYLGAIIEQQEAYIHDYINTYIHTYNVPWRYYPPAISIIGIDIGAVGDGTSYSDEGSAGTRAQTFSLTLRMNVRISTQSYKNP